MKINEVTEGVWQGIKSIGKDIASVVGTGLPRERKIKDSLEKQIIANNQALTKLISDLKGDRYPTESELTQYFINKGWTSGQAKDLVNDAFTTIADVRNKAEADYPKASPIQVAKLVMTKFYKNQKKQDQEDLSVYQTGDNTANLAKALVAKGAVDMLPPKQPQSQTAVPVQQGFVTAVVAPTSGGERKFWYDGKNWKEYFGSNWPQDIETSQTVTNDKVIAYLAKQVQLKNTEKVPYGTSKQAKRKS